MGRKSKTGLLDVYMNGELVGCWKVDSRQEHQFAYAASWLKTPRARPISLSLPLRPAEDPYRGDRVSNFFENLLPDSQEIRRRIQARFQLPSDRPFALLEEIGRDCVGALQLLPQGALPPQVRAIRGKVVTPEEIERRLLSLPTSPAFGQAAPGEELRISLAGAQEKTAYVRHQDRWLEPEGATPTTHIFKLPIGRLPNGIDLSTSVENEWLCQKVLQAYSVPVAEAAIEQFGAVKVLVVTRFDRRLAADGTWIIRLPQEDLCQALGMPGALKYESDGGPGIDKTLALLLGSRDAEADRLDFFRTQLVYWLLCAIDGHGKNFSLFLEPGSRFRLAPRYDVVSAWPAIQTKNLSIHRARMAMAVRGKNRHYGWREIRRHHWEETGSRCGLRVEDLMQELIERTPQAVAELADNLPEGFPAEVADPILEGLLAGARRLQS